MLTSLSTSLRSVSTSLILRGVLAVVAGVIAFGWPGITILALVIVFAIYAFTDAVFEGMRAFGSATAGPVIGHLLLAAGVVAIVWPGPTALVLVLVIGIWASTGGLLEIFAAFQAGETAGTRALFIIAGLVSVAFGVVVFARPGLGAATVALLFGLYSFICGISLIPTGIDARRTGKTLHQVTSEAA